MRRGAARDQIKKCIIMHVWDGIWRKVHYSAVFGWEKKTENALNAEFAETQRKDPKVRSEKNVALTFPPAADELHPAHLKVSPTNSAFR